MSLVGRMYSMHPSKDEYGVLNLLGLTLSEARVYLVLVRYGPSPIKRICQISGISREHLYAVTRSLENKGFIEREIGSPILFRAFPLKDTVSILLKDREKETGRIISKLNKLVCDYRKRGTLQLDFEDQNQFVIVSGKKAVFSKVIQWLEEARKDVKWITNLKKCAQWWELYEDILVRTLERGVKLQWIIGDPQDRRLLEDFVAKIKPPRNSFELKIMSELPCHVMVIDEKIMAISETSKEDSTVGEVPVLYSNNLSITGLALSYFNLVWENAQDFMS
jgi:sugar-specific transcriptional regulator TrmB